MTESTLRCGVVGIGFGQHVLVPAFASVPGIAVTALAASSQERAERVAARLSIPGAYGDWRALVESPDVDAVVIAVPPWLQPDIIRAAIIAGKPVFCEKPVALDANTALELAELADAAGVANAVDFIFPLTPAWQKLHAELRVGTSGQLRNVQVRWNVESRGVRERSESWKNEAREGGGVLNSFVSHVFHYLEWLAGPLNSVSCELGTAADLPSNYETIAVLTGQFASGANVGIFVSNHSPGGRDHCVEFHGADGILMLANSTADYINGFSLALRRRDGEATDLHEAAHGEGNSDGRIGAVRELAAKFRDSVLTGCAQAPTLRDGWRVQLLIDAARRAAETGCRQTV